MKLSYATAFDSEDIRNWSGLGVYYAKMLHEAGFTDFNCLGLHRETLPLHFIPFLKAKLNFYVLGKKEIPIFNIAQSQAYAQVIHKKIGDCTHILSPNTVILAHLRKDLKKILFTDSTLDNLLNFYPNYCNLKKEDVQKAQELEHRAIEASNLLIYTSKWAADSAIKDYNAEAKKVFIVPFGANLTFVPGEQELKAIIKKRNIAQCVNLLFIGIDWVRKGGEYAVEVTKKLNELGIRTILHVAGIRDLPTNLNEEFIIDHGFISKRTGKSEQKFTKLISQCDFLILPSLADCTPVAFSEANAFGVPCLASNVGGHTSIIKNGINGKTFGHIDFVENAVRYITDLIQTKNTYHELCLSSYNEYLTELNWKSTGAKISKLIHAI